MKYIKFFLYFLISITFIYLITNIDSSIKNISVVLISFFNNLLPYLLTFLIINQVLIKTHLISVIGYFLQLILYPVFKINAKNCSLLILSLLNGFPSSVLYSKIMKKNDNFNSLSTNKIASLFFLPSFTFVFYIIKNGLSDNLFLYFIISLYLPAFLLLFIHRFKSNDEFTSFTIIKNELKNSFTNFEYISDLKEVIIFENAYTNAANLLEIDNIVLVEGRLSIREDEDVKIVARDIKEISEEESKVKILKINITDLEEGTKKKLRGALKFFSGEKNNTPVQVINGEKILDCGTIYLNKEILEEFKELVGVERVSFE